MADHACGIVIQPFGEAKVLFGEFECRGRPSGSLMKCVAGIEDGKDLRRITNSLA